MIFVTGGTGLVGMHAVATFLRRGERLRLLVREGSDRDPLLALLRDQGLSEDVMWVEGDLFDTTFLVEAMEGCTAVFHAAAMVSFHAADRDMLYKVNVEGTANVVNAALEREIQTFYYISSVAALGRGGRGSVTEEETEWKDGPELTNYARSKHLAEREVWRGHEEGLRVVVVNPGVIVGRGDFSRSSAALYSNIDKGLPFFPAGSNGFVAVEDVVDACFYLRDNGRFNERYLLVGEHQSFQHLFNKIAESIAVLPPQKSAPNWLLNLAWRAAWVWEKISGKRAVITREAVQNTDQDYRYSAEKMSATGFAFRPLDAVIKSAGEAYKAKYKSAAQ
ncbi:MAG: NAD-dependent epimerase/dehydratase family protein [Cryomorphaceae bacterium]|nr:NAD-dependent epimerase/dehydratase family protein [Cryomorphaceae bacterium]